MKKFYFRKKSIPELSSYSQSKKLEILKSIEPHWMVVVSFYAGIIFTMLLGKSVGVTVFVNTGSYWLSPIIGGSIVLAFYFIYEFILLNFYTRKKVATKLGN